KSSRAPRASGPSTRLGLLLCHPAYTDAVLNWLLRIARNSLRSFTICPIKQLSNRRHSRTFAFCVCGKARNLLHCVRPIFLCKLSDVFCDFVSRALLAPGARPLASVFGHLI